MLASIIIRTYNEEKYLPQLLQKVKEQDLSSTDYEVIVVDSGSTDRTLDIAKEYSCKIVHILKDEFSFGRSLNRGCSTARGDYLVFISGHCIPVDQGWLRTLVKPLINNEVVYAYGRQIGGSSSKFSERELFNKYYPADTKIPQEGFFCNNANAALIRSLWLEHQFDEELPGLEDMYLAKKLIADKLKIGYVAESVVYHYHNEGWSKVKNRYEREAIALQHIMPEIHMNFSDFIRYFVGAVLLDSGTALQERKLIKTFPEIIAFRLMQFYGSYKGNHEHRKLSKKMKEKYFFPK